MRDTVWLHEMTTYEVEGYLQRRDEVIVPIGSTEAHGPHLPLGVDAFEALDCAEEIGRQADVIVAPPIWYGDCEHHMHKPGTIALQPETVIALLKDVYTSLLRHGFRKVITFNGHRLANLSAIDIASRMTKRLYPEAIIASIDPLALTDVHRALREAPGSGLHGCEFETSHMLFKHPGLVRREKIVFAHGYLLESRFVSVDSLSGGDRAQLYHGPQEQAQIAPLGHVGAPDLASAEKGRLLFEAIVKAAVEFIEDLRRWAAGGQRAQAATGEEGWLLLQREFEWRARAREEGQLAEPR